MPSLDERRFRNDSVAEPSTSLHNSRSGKPVIQPAARKGSYSLYPSCSPTPTSPRSPTEARTSDTLPRRPKPITQNTVIRVLSTEEDHPHIDATGEPLVEDFQTRLMMSPRRPSREDSLPGINSDMSGPPRTAGSDVDHSHSEAPRTRTLKSVQNHPTFDNPNRRSRSDFDGIGSSVPTTPETRQGSSVGSFSEVSTAPSDAPLVALQTHGLDDKADQMDTVANDDPKNFDLIAAPPEETRGVYAIEERADLLFSQDHLRQIFADPRLLLHFTSFLNSHRPKSVRTLVYYLDALKAIRAINYANAITEALDPLHGHDFTTAAPPSTANKALEERAQKAFETLAQEELPAYIAFTWIQVVSESVQRRVTGTLAPHLREMSEGLAEVFCLSDPSRPDNPIVFASEEFQRTTQYGMGYSVGRNCRFLQGPKTSKHSVRRLAESIKAGKEHSEVFLNYRRDGQPFMNLLMTAPLHDAHGTIRYFIGAQVDVSGLVKDCTDLEGLRRLLRREEDPEFAVAQDESLEKDEFQALAEMFNNQELATVRQHGGHLHQSHFDDASADDDQSDRASIVSSSRPRLLLTDPTAEALDRTTSAMPKEAAAAMRDDIRHNGRLQGVYQHYLLLRPGPSLRILFTSPSLRIPGILQTPFLSRIGGSARVRTELSNAFAEGRGVTAKIRWLTRPSTADDPADETEGRSRWIHATPLLNHRGEVGVWMVVLVDAESREGDGRRRFRLPPTVPSSPELLQRGDHASLRGHAAGGAANKAVVRTKAERQASRLTIGGTPVGASTVVARGLSGDSGVSGVAGQRYDVGPATRTRRAEVKRGGVVNFIDDVPDEARPMSQKSGKSGFSDRSFGFR